MGTYTTKICPSIEEIEIDVDYYYSPPEPPSKDMEYGGCPADFQIEAITHNGLDITKYLSDTIIDNLEEEVLKHIENY